MSARTMVLDWRGVPNLSKSADFYSIASTHETRPVLGNPQGRVLVGVSATIMYGPGGVANRPYNMDLFAAATRLNARTNRIVWDGGAGWYTVLFDLTKRGMVSAWLKILHDRFGWADGLHLDYASAWSWLWRDMEPTDAAWNRAYAAVLSAQLEQGKLALAQQFSLTEVVMAGSGAFWEQSPTSFGQTFESHAEDAKKFRDFTSRVDGRETLFVAELREYEKFPAWYRDKMREWATANDIVVSVGRDATAGGVL